MITGLFASSSAKLSALTILWLMAGSLVRAFVTMMVEASAGNTGSFCWGSPHTVIDLAKSSTPFHIYIELITFHHAVSLQGRISGQLQKLDRNFKLGNLESPALSLASFCFFLWSWSQVLKLGLLEIGAVPEEEGTAHAHGNASLPSFAFHWHISSDPAMVS